MEIISSAFCCTAITIRAVLAILTRPGRWTLRYRSPACCDAAGCPGASTGRWRMHKKRRVSPHLRSRNRESHDAIRTSSFSPLFADKILLTSLPCRYRGELSPKPELRQIFGVARKLRGPPRSPALAQNLAQSERTCSKAVPIREPPFPAEIRIFRYGACKHI